MTSPKSSEQPDKRVCHAPGDRCLACPHYYGKADVCKYAPAPGEKPQLSDTPRMDAALGKGHDWAFAKGCQLERELAEAKDDCRRLHREKMDALYGPDGFPRSATAANELLFRCHLAFNLGRAIDRSRLCRDIADYVVPLYKDRCG
jgi:hypothetical protein